MIWSVVSYLSSGARERQVLRSVDDVLELLAACDGVFDAPPPEGDPVDLLAHGLQCAEVLRECCPDDLGLHLAGLVHDLGHALSPAHTGRDHGEAAADAVRPVLGQRVARLVALHVPAKRYLAATDQSYGLSPASVASLARQGARMDEAEQAAFLTLSEAQDALALRHADDEAKVVGRQVPGLDVWAPRLRLYVDTLQ
jgi:predicted HD phosphohydrolase